jgi:class 3 adenylate cyclase
VRAALVVDPKERAPSPEAVAELWFGGSAERPKRLARNAPVGRVTLVFTDIEGSTRIWESRPELARNALRAHDAVMRSTLHRHGGYEVKTEGDAFMIAVPTALNAVKFCLDAQRQLHDHPWSPELLALPEAAEAPGFRGVRVRMGVHVGEPEVRADGDTVDYFGPMVNRAARVSQAGHGGQILVSGEVWDAVGKAAEDVAATPLGRFKLKGLDGAQYLVQVLPSELAERWFPAVRAAPA